MTKLIEKRCKTFPLEIEDDLHKALKHKAIGANKTLHAFIIDVLTATVREEPAHYALTPHNAEASKRK